MSGRCPDCGSDTPQYALERGCRNAFHRTFHNRLVGMGSAFRGVRTNVVPKRTGEQNYTTIAAGGCWCGQESGHDWPGKAIGVAHPREGEEPSMSALEHIDKRDLKGYHRTVQDALIELINRRGARYRFTGTGAMLLFPPDPNEPPFKISNQRQPKQQLKFLIEFAEKYTKPEVKEQDVLKLAEALNGAEHQPSATSATEGGEDNEEETEVVEQYEVPEGSERWRDTDIWLRPDGTYICTREGKEFPNGRGVGGHWASAHDVHPLMRLTPEQRSAASRRAGETRRRRRQEATEEAPERAIVDRASDLADDLLQRAAAEPAPLEEALIAASNLTMVTQAIDLLIRATGYKADGDRVAELESEVERLQDENDDLRKQVEDNKARLSLLREALSAVDEP